MNNSTFIDVMDKINSLAKEMNFTNGIAWARKALDDEKLSSYDYGFYDNCHHLRNLLAHGCARDINISTETLNVAYVFYKQLQDAFRLRFEAPQPVVRSRVQQDEGNRKKQDAIVRVGDYVVAPYSDGFGKKAHYIYRVVNDKEHLRSLTTRKIFDVSAVISQGKPVYVLRPDYNFEPMPGSRYEVTLEPYAYTPTGNPDKYMVSFWYNETRGKQVYHRTYDNIGYLARLECFRNMSPMTMCLDPDDRSEEYMRK